MKNRRMRPFAVVDSGQWLKTGSIVYISVSILLLIISAVFFLNADTTSPNQSGSFFSFIAAALPIALWSVCLMGPILLFLTMGKCLGCILGPGKRLTSAMEKMSRGDLGWRLTLRRGDEMSEVAESVSRASQSLAERIGKMQSEIKGIKEVEEYLIDSISGSRNSNPYFIKALRKLKISTSRLNADINEFQLSMTESSQAAAMRQTVHSRMQRAQSVGGQ